MCFLYIHRRVYGLSEINFIYARLFVFGCRAPPPPPCAKTCQMPAAKVTTDRYTNIHSKTSSVVVVVSGGKPSHQSDRNATVSEKRAPRTCGSTVGRLCLCVLITRFVMPARTMREIAPAVDFVGRVSRWQVNSTALTAHSRARKCFAR